MRVSLKAERPAVRAKGTVRPSERPIVKSERTRGSKIGFGGRLEGGEVEQEGEEGVP